MTKSNKDGMHQANIEFQDGQIVSSQDLIKKNFNLFCKQAHKIFGKPSSVWQATGLVSRGYYKVIESGKTFENEQHFVNSVFQKMKSIFLDHIKSKNAIKRGGGHPEVELDTSVHTPHHSKSQNPLDKIIKDEEKDGLDKILASFESALISMEKAGMVRERKTFELRAIQGLTIEETARALGVGHSTVERDWRHAKAWIYRELTVDRNETS